MTPETKFQSRRVSLVAVQGLHRQAPSTNGDILTTVFIACQMPKVPNYHNLRPIRVLTNWLRLKMRPPHDLLTSQIVCFRTPLCYPFTRQHVFLIHQDQMLSTLPVPRPVLLSLKHYRWVEVRMGKYLNHVIARRNVH